MKKASIDSDGSGPKAAHRRLATLPRAEPKVDGLLPWRAVVWAKAAEDDGIAAAASPVRRVQMISFDKIFASIRIIRGHLILVILA
jgi:hypothetical protein